MAMMTLLRKRMASIFLILAIAFIITIVFDWGMGGFKSSVKPGVIALVDKTEITRDEYQQALDNRFAYERQVNPDQEISDQKARQLRGEVWEGLVKEVLLEKYLKKAKLEVTNKEVAYTVRYMPPAYIMNNPAFRDSITNQFNEALYEEVLRDPEYYDFALSLEENTRRSLLQQKISERIFSGVHISDAEAKDAYKLDNTKASANYILVKYRDMTADTSLVSEADIAAEYQKRLDEFETPASKNVQFVLFEDKPSVEDTTAARNLIFEIKGRIERGTPFEEMAAEFGTDGTSEKGGDLGWFDRTKMVAEFTEAAFGAKIGELVGPVETQFGFHLIRVDDKRGKGEKEEVKARHILVKIERSNQTMDDLASRADAFRDEAEQSDFLNAAKIFNVKVDTLENITETGRIPRFGSNQAVIDYLFKRKLGNITPVYRFRQGYVVMKGISETPAGHKPLAEVRTQIQRDLLKEHQFDMAEAKINEVYAKYQEVKDLEKAAQATETKVLDTKRPFKVGEYVSSVGRDYEFTLRAIDAEVGEVLKPFRGTNGWYLVQVSSKEEADMTKWEENKDATIAQLIQARQNDLFNEWFEIAKENAKIEDFRYHYYTQY